MRIEHSKSRGGARPWRSIGLIAGLVLCGLAQAADVSLTATDPVNSDSWDEAGRWSNAAAPAAGNNYFTAGFQLRTPNALASDTTFAGGALTVNGGSVLYKGSGNRTTTINNLTLDGGMLVNGVSATTWTIAGNKLTVNTTGSISSSQDSTDRHVVINPPINGAGTITTSGRGSVQFVNTTSPFTGKWILQGNQTRVAADTSFGVVPATFVPDAVTLDGGVLLNRDTEVAIAATRGITLTANGGRLEAGWSKSLSINTVIAGPGGLTIVGDATPGMICLNAANTYTGPTVVQSSGWVQIDGSLDPASTVTVQAGGLLAGNGTINGPFTASANGNLSPGRMFLPGTLTLNNAASLDGCVLHVDLSNATTVGGGVNDLLVVNGDLNLNGTVTVSVTALAGTLAPGPYRIISYTGNLTGSAANLVAAASGYTITFDTSTAGEVNMYVQDGAPATLTWQGDNLLNLWDMTTPNWLEGGAPEIFRNGDNVVLDDTGANLVQITVSSPNLINSLVPGSITVDASKDYTLSGGRLAGPMTLTKKGPGILTLATANANLPNYFDGPIVIEGGRVRAGYVRALGSTLGGTIARTGGALDVNGQNLGYEPVYIEGSGPDGNGALVNYGGGQNNALRVVTLTGDATVGGSGRFDIRGVPADTFLNTGGNPYKLTKKGAIQFSLVGVTVDPALGDIDVQEGVFSYESTTTSLGDPMANLTVAPNAQLMLWSAANPLDKVITLNGGTTANINNGSGANTLVGPITLNAESPWNVAGTSLTVNGPVQGAGGIVKSGSAPLLLNGINTYAGRTVVAAGKLTLGASASIANSSDIVLGNGTTLDVTAVAAASPSGAFELNTALGQTLSGSGTVAGNLVVGNSCTVAPGAGAGTLACTGNVTLDGATAVFELGTATTTGGGVNDLMAITGNLTLAGTITLVINALAPLDTANPYTIATYTGALDAAAGTVNVVSDSRYTFTLDPVSAPGTIRVWVAAIGTGVEALTWQGSDPGHPTLWDVTATANWQNSASLLDKYFQGDSVRFDDTAASTSVALVGTLTPSALTIDNPTKDFVWTGAGKLSGPTGIAKQGAGKLTVASAGANENTGATTIAAGTIEIGDGGTVGSLNSAAIANSGRLVFNRSDAITVANVISGTGTVEKQGAGLMILSQAQPALDGPVVVSAGTLRTGNATALGTVAAGTTVDAGATLDVNGQNLAAEPISVAGAGVGGLGAIYNSGAAQNNATRFVTLNGDTTFGGTTRWDIRTDTPATTPAALTGNGHHLTKVGANEIWLVNLGDTALGQIDVNAGILGLQGTTTLGVTTDTLRINPGATLGFYGLNNSATPLEKVVVMNNGAWLNNNGDNYFAGPVTLNGANTLNMSATLRLLGAIDGPGTLIKAGSGTLVLGADNTYSGQTVVQAGYLRVGNGGASGSIVGTVYNSGRVDIERADTYTQTFDVVGTGGIAIRTPAGVVWDGSAKVDITGNVEIGRDVAGVLTIQGTANPVMGHLLLGNPASIAGEVYQTGGDVVVKNSLRIGHWPTETSTYTLEGGTITLTGIPTGAAAGSAEQNGVFYIGVDGTGIFTQIGGTVQAHGLVLDNRSNTAGDDTFNLEGGRFVIGPSGITSGGAANTYIINLTGGTLAAAADWSSGLAMNLNGSVSSPTFDTGPYTVTLSGPLGGVGGVIKTGAGTLVLSGTDLYDGQTLVEGGTLSVVGAIGTGVGKVQVNQEGTLNGTGTVAGPIEIAPGGTLAPGLSIGTLTCSHSSAPAVTLAGTVVMEIAKSGMTRTGDRLFAPADIACGGALTVTASGDPLSDGDTFRLFETAAMTGTFATVTLPELRPGLVWDVATLYLDGTIRVVATEPATLTVSVTGTGEDRALEIAWPAIYGNHVLQYQVNPTDVGLLPDTWADVPNPTNPFIIKPIPTTQNAFYRLIRF